MSRERGVEVEVLDYEKLAAACREHGLAAPSYSGNAILRRRDGAAVVISYEGVANTELREGMVCVTTMFTEWQYLPLEVAEACRTGERVDLADHIRTFGSRLDVNHWHWYQWARTLPRPSIPTAGYPANLAVNIYSAAMHGEEEQGGYLFDVYEDDPDRGVVKDTLTTIDQGPVPDVAIFDAALDDDTWLYGVEAVRFLMHIWCHRALSKTAPEERTLAEAIPFWDDWIIPEQKPEA